MWSLIKSNLIHVLPCPNSHKQFFSMIINVKLIWFLVQNNKSFLFFLFFFFRFNQSIMLDLFFFFKLMLRSPLNLFLQILYLIETLSYKTFYHESFKLHKIIFSHLGDSLNVVICSNTYVIVIQLTQYSH